MDYERGLAQLKQLLRGTAWEQDFQIYEFRLRENLRKEQLFGANAQNTSERGPIIYELNRLAAQKGTSFNDLCLLSNIPNLQTPPKPTYATSQNAQPQPSNIKSNSQRTKVYISFKEGRDTPYLNELHTHLDPYALKGVNYWDRSKTLPGAPWRDEITTALNSTKVAILLVSADFLAAAADPKDPIATHELPALLSAASNQEITLLNVIVRPCSIEDSDLEPFQPFNPQPLSSMNRNDREEIWQYVVRQVRNLLR